MLLMGPNTQLDKDVTMTQNCIRDATVPSMMAWLMSDVRLWHSLGAQRQQGSWLGLVPCGPRSGTQEVLGASLFSKLVCEAKHLFSRECVNGRQELRTQAQMDRSRSQPASAQS